MTQNPIKHIIWDMDGTLFSYDDQCVEAIINALADVMPDFVPVLDRETALAIARQSHQENRNCFTGFIRQYGLDFNALVRASYEAVNLDAMLNKNPVQRAKIMALSTEFGLNHAILTRSSQIWAKRVINHLDLQHIFNENNIIACDNDPALDKSKSTWPFMHTMQKTGFDPAFTLMVEDTEHNLKHAKLAGLQTALVQIASDQPKQDFVDHHFTDTMQLLDTIPSWLTRNGVQ